MLPQRQAAYRHLLYQAMLDIRCLCPYRSPESVNLERWKQGGRKAGAIADWLHNLAMYSAKDFSGFDEEAFWDAAFGLGELSEIKKYYRLLFEMQLAKTCHP